MGRDEASLLLNGEPLLQHTVRALAKVADEIVLVAAPDQALPAIVTDRPVIVARDAEPGEGPLVDMAAGLAVATAPIALVVGGDMPMLQAPLLRLLVERVVDGAWWVLPVAAERP